MTKIDTPKESSIIDTHELQNSSIKETMNTNSSKQDTKTLTNDTNEVSLTSPNEQIIQKINSETNLENVKNMINIFNLNLTKKNMLRLIKEDALLDSIINQASERINKRPDELSHKDLLDYFNSIQAHMDKSQKNLESLDTVPMIQVNQNTNEVNINMAEHSLGRESREKIIEVINTILKQSTTTNKNIVETIDLSEDNTK